MFRGVLCGPWMCMLRGIALLVDDMLRGLLLDDQHYSAFFSFIEITEFTLQGVP